MRRRLIILRHAKSSWSSGAASDHQRPLNQRGERAAPRVAQRLVELEWVPEVILASDSRRTRQTWERMEPWLADVQQVEWRRELYLADPETMRRQLWSLDSGVQSAMLLGHNPGCEGLLWSLSGSDEPLKTADAALLQGDGETWPAALGQPWQLAQLVRARE